MKSTQLNPINESAEEWEDKLTSLPNKSTSSSSAFLVSSFLAAGLAESPPALVWDFAGAAAASGGSRLGSVHLFQDKKWTNYTIIPQKDSHHFQKNLTCCSSLAKPAEMNLLSFSNSCRNSLTSDSILLSFSMVAGEFKSSCQQTTSNQNYMRFPTTDKDKRIKSEKAKGFVTGRGKNQGQAGRESEKTDSDLEGKTLKNSTGGKSMQQALWSKKHATWFTCRPTLFTAQTAKIVNQLYWIAGADSRASVLDNRKEKWLPVRSRESQWKTCLKITTN